MARQVCSCPRTRVRESAWDMAEGLGLGRGSQGCPPTHTPRRHRTRHVRHAAAKGPTAESRRPCAAGICHEQNHGADGTLLPAFPGETRSRSAKPSVG